MIYAIYAYEQTYGGLHGMNSPLVVECDSYEEAEEIGLEQSLDVMDSYSCIMESIYEDASMEFEEDSDDWYAMVESLKQEQVAYEIFEVKDTKGKSLEELENEFYNNKKEFLKTYCFVACK